MTDFTALKTRIKNNITRLEKTLDDLRQQLAGVEALENAARQPELPIGGDPTTKPKRG